MFYKPNLAADDDDWDTEADFVNTETIRSSTVPKEEISISHAGQLAEVVKEETKYGQYNQPAGMVIYNKQQQQQQQRHIHSSLSLSFKKKHLFVVFLGF